MVESTVTISPDLSAALQGLKPDALRKSIARGLVRATALITGEIQAKRLTGKGPFPVSQNRLGVKTGRLRQSLTYTKTATITGDVVQTTIGTNVKYGAAHEFGYKGPVKVKAHTATITQVFGRKLAKPLTVARKPYTRNVTIPERRPIRTGIVERLPMIENEIAREVLNATR